MKKTACMPTVNDCLTPRAFYEEV